MATADLDLLLNFAKGLQAWEAAVAQGAAALTVLQRVFAQLDNHQTKSRGEVSAVHKRLLELAPSFRLEAYIRRSAQPGRTAAPNAAAELHTALTAVRAAVASAGEAAASLCLLCQQFQEHALSHPWEPGVGRVAEIPGAEAADEDGSTDTGPQQQQQQGLHVEELALLLDTVACGAQRGLHLMEAAIAGLSLETTPDELAAISMLWELQPFSNEAAAACIVEAAEAAIS